MKLRIDVEKVFCEIELTPTDDDSGDEVITTEACISGNVSLSENGFSMKLISEEERKLLANCLRDGFVDFVLRMTGSSIVEDGD